MKRKVKKVILFNELFTPYRIPLFNQINISDDFDLSVYYLTYGKETKKDWENLKLDSEFNSLTLSGIHFRINYERYVHIHHNLFFILIKHKPDIIILPGFNVASMQALIYAKLFRKPTIVWSEATKYTENKISTFRYNLRKIMLKYIDAAIVPGKLAEEYLSSILNGRKRLYVYRAFNGIDTHFYRDVEAIYKKDKSIKQMRQNYCKKNILFIGQLIERKGVWEMLQVFKSINKKTPNVGLIILGRGTELDRLKEYVKENDMTNVFFEGFIQQKDILKYFAISDLFILLSHYDCNPLVIYEAISTGLPIIANYKVGNTPELVHDAKNGYAVDIENIPDIIEKTLKILQDEEIQKSYSEYSIKLSEKVTYKESAEVFQQAIKSLV